MSHLWLQRGNNLYQVPIFQHLLVTCQKHPIRPFPISFLVFVFLPSPLSFPRLHFFSNGQPKYFHFFIKISNLWSSTLMYSYNVFSGYLYCFSRSVHIGMVTTFCSHLQDKTKQSYLNWCLGAIINFFKNVQMCISV